MPPMYSEAKAGCDNRGNYVDIVGFEIDGSATRRCVTTDVAGKPRSKASSIDICAYQFK